MVIGQERRGRRWREGKVLKVCPILERVCLNRQQGRVVQHGSVEGRRLARTETMQIGQAVAWVYPQWKPMGCEHTQKRLDRPGKVVAHMEKEMIARVELKSL